MAQKVVREFIDDIKSAIGGFIESARKVKPTSNGRPQRGAVDH